MSDSKTAMLQAFLDAFNAHDDLHEVVVEAWLARAPKRLAKAYLDTDP